ncbi:hypothetical protein D3C81_1309230 [compost metagenome]
MYGKNENYTSESKTLIDFDLAPLFGILAAGMESPCVQAFSYMGVFTFNVKN